MSKHEKLLKKLLNKPKDFTWNELVKLLANYGFEEIQTGKTGGSRRGFLNKDNIPIKLHKPHPKEILKSYQIEQIIETLKQENLIWKILWTIKAT